jgi:hypothetical protein
MVYWRYTRGCWAKATLVKGYVAGYLDGLYVYDGSSKQSSGGRLAKACRLPAITPSTLVYCQKHCDANARIHCTTAH